MYVNSLTGSNLYNLSPWSLEMWLECLDYIYTEVNNTDLDLNVVLNVLFVVSDRLRGRLLWSIYFEQPLTVNFPHLI